MNKRGGRSKVENGTFTSFFLEYVEGVCAAGLEVILSAQGDEKTGGTTAFSC